jgi:peptide/nickel transport system substrate-binding protein
MSTRSRGRSRAFSFAGLLVALALIITGCSSDEPASEGTETTAAGTETTAAGTETTAAGTETTTTGAEMPSGELVVAGPAAPISLDPHGAEAMEDPTLIAGAHIFDTLVKLAANGVEPSLATSWSNPDDVTWEVTIRDDVTFHNGDSLTSADVKASIERVIAEGGPFASFWSVLDSVDTPDDTTVVITTTAPFGGMMTNLSLLPIVPAGASDFANPVGSGPFMVESFTSGESLVLAANQDYWGGAPQVAKLTFRSIPEVSSRITALLNGEIDFTWGLPPDQFGEVQDASNVTFVTADSYQHYYQWFNSSREPFTDPDVRRALAYAVDWDSIIADLFGDSGVRARAPIPEAVFGFAPNELYTYDPAMARQLLADAGYPDGFDANMQFASGSAPLIRELGQAMASDWAEVGVNVELLEKEVGQWVEDLLALNWDMNLGFNVTLTGDANFTTGRLYTCAAERTGYCSEELDAKIAEAQATIDDDARAEIWGEAGAIIWNEAVGLFPMDVKANYAYRDTVTGFTPSASGNPVFTAVSIEE